MEKFWIWYSNLPLTTRNGIEILFVLGLFIVVPFVAMAYFSY